MARADMSDGTLVEWVVGHGGRVDGVGIAECASVSKCRGLEATRDLDAHEDIIVLPLDVCIASHELVRVHVCVCVCVCV